MCDVDPCLQENNSFALSLNYSFRGIFVGVHEYYYGIISSSESPQERSKENTSATRDNNEEDDELKSGFISSLGLDGKKTRKTRE